MTHSHLYEAWIEAWSFRCCPPDKILAGEMTPELRRHFEVCPLCRANRSVPPVNLDITVEKDKGLPLPGELWSLSPQLGAWGPKRRWYNPPVVMILQKAEKAEWDHFPVPVVQTYTGGDLTLAGPGDIPLDQGLAGFAEPWNRYSVRSADLFLRLGRVSPQCLESVRQAEQASIQDIEIEIGSLLWFFRHMEVETGFMMIR